MLTKVEYLSPKIELSPLLKLPRGVISVSGLPVAGKSATVEKLGTMLQGPCILDIDKIRFDRFGGCEFLSEAQEAGEMKISYEDVHRLTGEALDIGKAVLVAATHSGIKARNELRRIVWEHDAPLLEVVLQFEKLNDFRVVEEIKRRIAQRNNQLGVYSNIRSYADFERVLSHTVPYDDEFLKLDALNPVGKNVWEILKAYHALTSSRVALMYR